MKCHVLPLLLTAAASVQAFDLFRRDASASEHVLVKRVSSFAQLIIADLNNFTTITDEVTVNIKNFTDLSNVLPINTATADLLAAISKATDDANTEGTISETDAQALGPPTQFLAYAANESIAALISKKPLFLQYGLGDLVVTSLKDQMSASVNFSTALFAKIPSSLLSVSTVLNSQVAASLQQGLDCFQGKNETCNPNPVNATRTIQAAQDSGAIPKGAAGRSAEISGLLTLGAAVAVGVLFAA